MKSRFRPVWRFARPWPIRRVGGAKGDGALLLGLYRIPDLYLGDEVGENVSTFLDLDRGVQLRYLGAVINPQFLVDKGYTPQVAIRLYRYMQTNDERVFQYE